ncbi:MAG: sigma-54-dependent transcriptional regulator [Planctomycetota bacterium]
MGGSAGLVLVVDDDSDMCAFLATALAKGGFAVEWRTDPSEALALLGQRPFDAVVTDLNMRGMTGLELCERVVADFAGIPVLVLTAFGSLDAAIGAIRAGAYDFVTKPFDVQVLTLAIKRAVEHHALREELRRLREQTRREPHFAELVGESQPMQGLFRLLDKVAPTDSAVLIQGETGTGKELCARALHARSRRAGQPFVAVNCAALPEGLLESELFGHLKGAFSGAERDNPGLLTRAHGGTLFLDEVGDMPQALQAKVLRVLQDGRVRPVGGASEREVDLRVIAATHRDLEAAIERGAFREDLYFRLHVIEVEIPPLRARGNDVLLLAQSFVERYAEKFSKQVTGLSSQAAERLLAYDWPGNVRELQNCIERAVTLTESPQLVPADLPRAVREHRRDRPSLIPDDDDPSRLPTLEEVERRYVLHVLRALGNNKTTAAQVLGLDRKTLYRRLERYKVETEES